MRCTEVADRPLPDGEFSCRDLGDRGLYVGDLMIEDWYTKGCEVCRNGILSSWPPPTRLFSIDEWHSYIHRCDQCRAYWLYGQREAHVIPDSEALSIIESNFFDETALAPIPFCVHQTSNRSLVEAIVKKSGLALASGEVCEYPDADPTSVRYNSRYVHVASGIQWIVYLPDHAYPGDVVVLNSGSSWERPSGA